MTSIKRSIKEKEVEMINEEMIGNSSLSEDEKNFLRHNIGLPVPREFELKAKELFSFTRKELTLKAWAKLWRIS